MPKKSVEETPVEEAKIEEASVEEVKVEEVAPAPVEEARVVASSSEETLDVYVSFDDVQIARINDAGFEPASVRNEFGLAKMKGEPQITLTEAIARAKVRYGKE